MECPCFGTSLEGERQVAIQCKCRIREFPYNVECPYQVGISLAQVGDI